MLAKRSDRTPTVLLAAEGLRPKASGIGRVARLTAKVLAEQHAQGRLRARALALNDTTATGDLGLPVQVCAGSRARFVLECARAAVECSHFLHDATSVARAHPKWFYPSRPGLVWIHGIEVWDSARAAHLRTLERADCLVSNSNYTRERAHRLHGQFQRAHVCWLATEADDSSRREPLPDAEQTVLVLGRIDPHGGRKGHRELIEAWPRVVAEVPKARLIMAGGGAGDTLVRHWVSQSSARESLEVAGFVPEAEVESLWRRASVFAMPSRGEGFGLSYVEAMRHGLPVIGSVHDAAVEINRDGETGFNVDLQQPDALANKLIELLSQPALIRRMGEAGRERWHQNFRYSSFRERFTPILEGFLGRG
jgi:phosphatidyl-myo-inositol dimannoside synthase